jgi:hypothetical protein
MVALAVMIHASSVNRDPNGVIRLATDLRFANADAPYDERWCKGWVELASDSAASC